MVQNGLSCRWLLWFRNQSTGDQTPGNDPQTWWFRSSDSSDNQIVPELARVFHGWEIKKKPEKPEEPDDLEDVNSKEVNKKQARQEQDLLIFHFTYSFIIA